MAEETALLVPQCRVSLAGKPLAMAHQARLVRVEVDLDVDLFGRCDLLFHDPQMELINGSTFSSGTRVEVKLGYAPKLLKVFEGEVVALEPRFVRDQPPALRVVCMEALHRLALSQMTRAFNNVDDKEIATKIAQKHGLSAQAPAGSKSNQLQLNVTDAAFLRRLARKHGDSLRIAGTRLIIGQPPQGASLRFGPGSGIRRANVQINSLRQIAEVTAHGWDAKAKREVVARARPQNGSDGGNFRQGTLSLMGAGPESLDTASAEKVAKGRLRSIVEGYVTLQCDVTGDPRLVPGATVELEKLGRQIDGVYRVDKAMHRFDTRSYHVSLRGVRTSKKPSAQRAADKAAREAARRAEDERLENAKEPALLEVQVVKCKGGPLPNRPFRIFLPDGKTIEGRTAADGRVRVRTDLRGQYTLILPDLEPGGGPRSAPSPGPQFAINVVLVDEEGKPQEGIEYVIEPSAEISVAKPNGTTASDGRVFSKASSAGAYRLRLPAFDTVAPEAPGLGPLPTPPPAPVPGAHLAIEVLLANAEGEPQPGIAVRIELPDGRRVEGKSGADGFIRAKGGAPGEYRLTLSAFEKS